MNAGRNLLLASVAALLLTGLLVAVFLTENARMEEEARAHEGKSIARGARLYDLYCVECHGVRGWGKPGIGPPLNVADLWGGRKGNAFYGSLHDFVYLVTSVGHPEEDMPIWSEELGGQLRADQIEDLTQFILNWMGPQPIGVRPTDAAPIVKGEPASGAEIFARNCVKCHGNDAQGTADAPSLVRPEMAARGDNVYRLTINYGVPGTAMVPWAWDEILTPKDIEDLIAFFRSLQQ